MSARPRLPRAAGALAVTVLGAAVLAACTGGAEEVGSSGETGYLSGKGVITRLADQEREPPTARLAGTTLDGEPIALEDFAGDVVVVNVWGSWCPPCRAEAPALVEASKELRADGVRFLGINSRDLDPANAQAFVRRFDVPYPSIYDQAGTALLAFRGTLTANSIPSTVVIDEQGRVAARVLGEVTRSTLVGLVEDVREDGPARDAA